VNCLGDGLPQVDEIRPDETVTAADAPVSRHPWIVLSLLFLLTVIIFVARQTISVLAPVLRTVFGLTNQQYGRIVSALGFGMMTGEFPMGYMMDKLGARMGLSLAVLGWSAATGSQVLAGSGLQLGITQFGKGTCECGAYSGGIKTVNRLFAKKDRTLAIGIFNGGSVIGATIAPPLIVFLLQHFGFRIAFLVPTLAALLWIPLWWVLYKKEPKVEAIAGQGAISIKAMLSQSSTWAVMLCRFFIGPVMQFYWYWIPSYLFAARHLSMIQIGTIGWIPFLMGDVGGIAGGWFAGLLMRRGINVRNSRRISMYGSAVLCLTSIAVPFLGGLAPAMIMICVAIAADNFLSANMFATVTDLFPDSQVGRAAGLMGLAGGLGGMLFPLLTGFLVDRISYAPAFMLVGIMPLIGTIAVFGVGRKYRTLDKPAMAMGQA